MEFSVILLWLGYGANSPTRVWTYTQSLALSNPSPRVELSISGPSLQREPQASSLPASTNREVLGFLLETSPLTCECAFSLGYKPAPNYGSNNMDNTLKVSCACLSAGWGGMAFYGTCMVILLYFYTRFLCSVMANLVNLTKSGIH